MKWFSAKMRTRFLCATAVLILVFSGFLVSNMMARNMVQSFPSFDNLSRAVTMDVFERNDYKLSYVMNAGSAPDVPQVQQRAQEYAAQLAEVDSNTIPMYLAAYYMQNGQMEQGMAMVEKYVRYTPSNPDTWVKAFDLMLGYADGSEAHRQGVERVITVLKEWNAANLGAIKLRDQDKLLLGVLGITVD